jgi:hypothetical protein
MKTLRSFVAVPLWVICVIFFAVARVTSEVAYKLSGIDIMTFGDKRYRVHF